jgi:N utilization substance protein A
VLLDEDTGVATVIVPDFQLSLAIGREGQNARLAARLTGWRIDIKSETQLEEERNYANQDWAEGQWVEDESGQMVWQPAEGGEAISAEAWGAEVEGAESGDVVDPVAIVAAEDQVDESDPVTVLESGMEAPEEAAIHVLGEPGAVGSFTDTPEATIDTDELTVEDPAELLYGDEAPGDDGDVDDLDVPDEGLDDDIDEPAAEGDALAGGPRGAGDRAEPTS